MTADRRFDAVLFDFSGVLVSSAFTHIGALGQGSGMTHDETLEFLLGPYDRDTDHLWHQVERGEAGIMDWVVDVQRRIEANGYDIDLGRLATMLHELDRYDQIADEARALRADGYRTALVTNNVAEGRDQWRPIFPLDELFDVVVDSSEVGMRKPNPAIYEHTLELLGGIAPDRAVMLDDHEGNLAGARSIGMAAILVGDPDRAVTELRQLLGR